MQLNYRVGSEFNPDTPKNKGDRGQKGEKERGEVGI